MADFNNSNGEGTVNKYRKPKMSIQKRKEVATYFMIHSKLTPNGLKSERGTLTNAAKKFDISRKHAGKLFQQGKSKFELTGSFTLTPDHPPGRPPLYDADTMRDTIREMPPYKRRSLRSMASELGIDHCTLGRYKRQADDLDDPIIIPHTNQLLPELTPHHEAARVFYARSRLRKGRYISMYNEVHIDEKWFFLSETQLRMYITPGEKVPNRKTPHKSHILKVMFLCAVARPRFGKSRVVLDGIGSLSDRYSPAHLQDDDGTCTFDGKIGLWPFLIEKAAVRSSANRPAGTMEQKPVKVNKARYRDYLINKVIPAIKAKWPEKWGRNGKKVKIQQDGASSHILETDPQWLAAASMGGWNIKLATQPARSPDVNILDLGFFRALQTKYWGIGFARNITELVSNVEQAFEEYDPMTLDKIWVTSSTILEEIILSSGDNSYKIPHMNKDRIIRLKGRLPRRLRASDDVIAQCDKWSDEEEEMRLEMLAQKLEEWEKEDELAAHLEEWQHEQEAELVELEELLEQEELAELLEEAEMMEEEANRQQMMVDGEDVYS